MLAIAARATQSAVFMPTLCRLPPSNPVIQVLKRRADPHPGADQRDAQVLVDPFARERQEIADSRGPDSARDPDRQASLVDAGRDHGMRQAWRQSLLHGRQNPGALLTSVFQLSQALRAA